MTERNDPAILGRNGVVGKSLGFPFLGAILISDGHQELQVSCPLGHSSDPELVQPTALGRVRGPVDKSCCSVNPNRQMLTSVVWDSVLTVEAWHPAAFSSTDFSFQWIQKL